MQDRGQYCRYPLTKSVFGRMLTMEIVVGGPDSLHWDICPSSMGSRGGLP
jgi:hypothetical protein